MLHARVSLTRSFALATLAILSLGLSSAGIASARPARAHTTAAERGPVGWQSYRRLDLLPLLREGVHTYQTSSHDPTGHNDDGFSGRYSCLHRVRLGCLMAAHTGPGELESVWTAGNQQGQSAPEGNLIVRLDGRTVIDRTWPELAAGRPAGPFAFPLALSPEESWGASSIQVPLAFHHSMQVISQFNPHFFHVVYRTFATGAGLTARLSRPSNPPDVISELRRAGRHSPLPRLPAIAWITHRLHVAAAGGAGGPGGPGGPGGAVVARLRGPGAITGLHIHITGYGTTPPEQGSIAVYEHARLRISFDGRVDVDAPLGRFFGAGLGPAEVRSLMFADTGGPTGTLSSWWPMPFARGAVVSIVDGSGVPITGGTVSVTWSRSPAWTRRLGAGGHYGYFHAVSRAGTPGAGVYYRFVRTMGAGSFDGVTLVIRGGDPPSYMEGNERAYVDGARRPQFQGTGTEDFFDGGWYFFGNTFTLPLSGYVTGTTPATGCPTGNCKSMYRLMIADGVPYSRSLLYEIQHGPENNVTAGYSSTAYLYERGS
jgi:hypothetical protein